MFGTAEQEIQGDTMVTSLAGPGPGQVEEVDIALRVRHGEENYLLQLHVRGDITMIIEENPQ